MPIELALAIVTLVNNVLDLIKLDIESQPAEVRAGYAKVRYEDLMKWRDFWAQLIPKEKP